MNIPEDSEFKWSEGLAIAKVGKLLYIKEPWDIFLRQELEDELIPKSTRQIQPKDGKEIPYDPRQFDVERESAGIQAEHKHIPT